MPVKPDDPINILSNAIFEKQHTRGGGGVNVHLYDAKRLLGRVENLITQRDSLVPALRDALDDLLDLHHPDGRWRTEYGEGGFNEAVAERTKAARQALNLADRQEDT